MSDTSNPTPTPVPSPTPLPTSSQRLIVFPGDPGRTYALIAYCPSWPMPYYSWTSQLWQIAFDSTCLLPIFSDPSPPGDTCYCWMPPITMSVDYMLKRVALDQAGNVVQTVDQDTMAVG